MEQSLDPKTWSELPYDMVREILGYVDDIDVRLAFDIKPRRNRLPMFDLKIQPLIWGEYWVDKFDEVVLYYGIKTLTGKFITSTNVFHVVWDSHTWHVVT